MGTVTRQCSRGLVSAESWCAIASWQNDAYGDNKNTVFGEKLSGKPEKQHRKAESAEIFTREEI